MKMIIGTDVYEALSMAPTSSRELLSFQTVGRVLRDKGDIETEFILMAKACGDMLPSVNEFAKVGRGSGTHLLKLVSPRVPVGQSVLRVFPSGTNRRACVIPSVDAKLSRVAKMVFRPLEVAGHEARHMADHVLNPDDLSPVVTQAFVAVFSAEALKALSDALTAELEISTLPAAEFPIIFLPRPGGGDIQATPVSPVEAYLCMADVTKPFQQRTADQPHLPRGHWHSQKVSDKPQNISAAIGKKRTRFLARMPRLFDRREAELQSYLASGRFPQWDDRAVSDAVMVYGDLLDRHDHYSNKDIRNGLDRRADVLIRGARAHVEEVRADAEAAYPGQTLPKSPSLADVILSRAWPGGGRDRARRLLTSDHFSDRLRLWEGRRAVRSS